MSARPRPVTATFKPRSMAPPTGVRTRSYSLSSGASTESLVSVLDHDSYVSPGEDSDLEEGTRNDRKSKVSFSSSPTKPHTGDTTYTTSGPADNNQLAASVTWERWMVAKAKETRLKQKQEMTEAKRKQEEEEKKREEQKKKLLVGEEKIKEWIERKNLSDKLHKRMNRLQTKSKEEVEAAKKYETEVKARTKYEEWMKQKKNLEKEAKRNQMEQKRKEQEAKEERQKKSKQVFDEWCKKAQNRPKSVHSSLGYTSGKLTGYYDTNAYPTPNFCNPLPWHPVEVPTAKPVKKRSKSARRWNPDKYF